MTSHRATDPTRTREFDNSTVVMLLTFGSMVGFMVVLGAILRLFGVGSWPVVAAGLVPTLWLGGWGLWLRRRNRRADVVPIGNRLHFWVIWFPMFALWGLDLYAQPSWWRGALLAGLVVSSTWVYWHEFRSREDRTALSDTTPEPAGRCASSDPELAPSDHR